MLGPTHPDGMPAHGVPYATLAALGTAEPADVGFASHGCAGAHAVLILNDTMAPALQRGDVVWAVPTRGYTSEGLYVFDRFGFPDVSRAKAVGPEVIEVTKDAPDYLPHVVTRAEFQATVIGRVVAPSLLDGRTYDKPRPSVSTMA